jgi:hypothetical protein
MVMDPSPNELQFAVDLERAFARLPPRLETGPDPVAEAVLGGMRRARIVRRVTIGLSGVLGVGIFAAVVSVASATSGWRALGSAIAELAEKAPALASGNAALPWAAAALGAALTILAGLHALRDL